ncbi:hypothetical protein GQ44DRAFT_731613 [Phaeosphaeriaceae sp. PMI808]|nr:hypothetical protein GQ44DRAFT_731613 [Phaeosphaeriaceae sp. PMI808]
MASSCSTSLLAPSFPLKIVPYVPPVPKPKPKSKAKSMATTKTAEHSRLGVAPSKDDGNWLHIDDFPMPDSNASGSLDPGVSALFGADASGSLDYDVVGGLGAASESEKPEHYQSDQESLDEGTNHDSSVAKTNSALNRLFDGSSLEFPLILESDAAEEYHSTTQVKPSNGASDYQENGYHAAVRTEGFRTGQHDNLDAASMRALSVEVSSVPAPVKESILTSSKESSPAEDEPLFNVEVISRLPLTHKRTCRSSSDTMIPSAGVPDITPEPELEDPRLPKRRRPSERQAESLILDHVPTPKPTPLPTPSGPDSRSRASSEPSPGPLDSGSNGGGTGSPDPPPNNIGKENGAHTRGRVEELLHSPRLSISPLEETEGDQYIDADSNRREINRKGSGGEPQDDEANQADEVSGRPLAKSSQRRKRAVPPVRERCRGPSRTAPRRRDCGTMPTRASRQVTSPQSRLLSTPRMDIATRSCSPQTFSPGTKAGDGSNINYGPSANMAYQITDLTLCPVPKGSSIVTAIVHCNELISSPNPTALDHKLFGEDGKVIRMTQLSPDSWMLLGYRYDYGASGACNREGPTLRNADWTSSPLSDASDDTNHLDDDGDEEYENGEEGDMRSRQRTRVPWLKSDDLRLLAYRDNMDMEWKDIFKRFPDRTPGAVRTRWHMLRGRRCAAATA